jgi:NAD(P)-dependent dehydrogenase (short-subunit alcohol dehydrogenase family)
VESITRRMAIELGADDITANAVALAPTGAELFRANNPPGSEVGARLYGESAYAAIRAAE